MNKKESTQSKITYSLHASLFIIFLYFFIANNKYITITWHTKRIKIKKNHFFIYLWERMFVFLINITTEEYIRRIFRSTSLRSPLVKYWLEKQPIDLMVNLCFQTSKAVITDYIFFLWYKTCWQIESALSHKQK